jgi:hypothetical protein
MAKGVFCPVAIPNDHGSCQTLKHAGGSLLNPWDRHAATFGCARTLLALGGSR